MSIPWYERIYALYKGEEFITEGNIRQISIETKKTIDFLLYMTYPSYRKRIQNSKNRLNLVLLEDD
ncbi:hypothetical protein [Bacillus sp. 1P06AnD]|uniref:hypothetical protein n=1 Tax=Bacillus sp. 1P06AnD TaxID=3132208 RepID=UPI00399F8C40